MERAVEKKEVAIPRYLRQQFPLLSAEIAIEKNRSLRGIPIVVIVRRRLEVPDKFSRIWIQRNNGRRVKAILAFFVRMRRPPRRHAISCAGVV